MSISISISIHISISISFGQKDPPPRGVSSLLSALIAILTRPWGGESRVGSNGMRIGILDHLWRTREASFAGHGVLKYGFRINRGVERIAKQTGY